MSIMLMRKATLDDLALLQYWDGKPHVISAGGDGDWFDWPKELAVDPPWREMLIAESEGRPIGIVQIIDPAEEDTRYWGDVEPDLRAIDIWIGEESDLGRGYGTQMMTLALARCFAPPEVSAVLIDPLMSNKRAQNFYRRMGFEDAGPRVFDADECLVMRISRQRWASLSE
ncbi:MAG: GNAT family N-acetyltransferase [Pseudomonadota bacterium]